MLDLLSDPSFHLLLVTAYVVGFVDPDEPTGGRRVWEYAADMAFWAGVILTAVLFTSHGAAAGGGAVIGAWAVAVAGFRRGIIAQRNTLWESCLWTMPLEQLIAAAERGGGMKALDKEARRTAKEPGRPRVRLRAPHAPSRASGWTGVLGLLPARGRRLTLLGIAIDTAACLVVMSGLSALLR